MKIRTRLVSWYFFTSLILISVFSIGTYWGMRHLLFSSLDDDLIQVKDEIVNSYNAETNSFEIFEHPYYLEAELSTFYLIIYNNYNKVLYKSDIVDKLNLHLPYLNSDTTYIATANILNKLSSLKSRNNEAQFRVIGRTIMSNNSPIGYLIIGESFEKINKSMNKLLEVLLFGIGFTTLMIFILAYFLTERSLRPIGNLINQTKKISYENLSKRLDIQNPEDEIGKLTEVLNNLLKRLQDAFQKQQEFMADAAHELKTPLTVLRTHWEGELNNQKIPEGIKLKLVQDIETITHLSKLINSLLLLTNSEYSHLRGDFEILNLSNIIQDVINNTSVLTELKNQTLTFDKPQYQVIINGDKAKLHQLFFNLIDNAIKYTPENGQINISLKTEGKFSITEIKDSGLGIPENEIPFIFRRFYRVSKVSSKKTEGNGLGLAIAKLITEVHKGEISVESKVGVGSIFIIKLPVHE